MFFNFLQKVRAYQTNFFTKRLSFIALKLSKFRKLIFYIWNSFPSKISAAFANLLRLFNNFSFSFLVYSCHWRRFIILSNDKSLELDLKNKEGNIKKSMNALRLSLVITEFSWHILIRKRRSIKKMYSKRNLHRLITSSVYRTNLSQNGYHLLPSVMVSYKQVSNILTYFSLTHILLRSPEDISCSYQFTPLFQVVFFFLILFWYICSTESFDRPNRRCNGQPSPIRNSPYRHFPLKFRVKSL